MANRKTFRIVTFHPSDRSDLYAQTAWMSKTEAILQFRHRVFSPYTRACFALERSDGRVTEISERNYELAEQAHHEALLHRDAVGVWG